MFAVGGANRLQLCRFSLITRTPTLIGKEIPLSPMRRISLNLKNYPLICRKIGVRIVKERMLLMYLQHMLS
jgi:hypothetical protein